MSIYLPLTITEQMLERFVPTRLYIKKHALTGLRYLGKTIHSDVESYKGSGKRWNHHLKKHGKQQAIDLLKRRVFQEISRIYPYLSGAE